MITSAIELGIQGMIGIFAVLGMIATVVWLFKRLDSRGNKTDRP